MKIISTWKGKSILVDDEDYELLCKFRWNLNNGGYATRGIHLADGRLSCELMHRQLLGLSHGDVRHVDHINGNKIDNRRSNLRVCSETQNNQNLGLSKRNKSGFKGVSWHAVSGKWQAHICYFGKRKNLGQFAMAEDAYEFYCLAADLVHGEFANHGRRPENRSTSDTCIFEGIHA